MKKLLITLLLALAITLIPGQAHADVNDFVIHEFNGRYELLNDIHGGRMVVKETIDLTFSDNNHGILRAIPTDYRGHSLKLKVWEVERDDQEEPYSTYGSANNEVLKIGRAEQTITGRHTYEITYEMQNIVSFWLDFDEWYWDINGDQWGQPFERVSGEVIMPEGWDETGLPTASCYSGSFGSAESECTMERTSQGYRFASARQFLPYEGLTVAIPVQKNIFTPRDKADWLRDNWWQLVGLIAGGGLGLVFFNQWRKHGKDFKGRGVIVPHYEPPKKLTPAEVGLLMDYMVDGKDLSATIIDLAVRGYIKIHDDLKKQLLIFKRREFSLELVNDDFSKLASHESKLIKALFTTHLKGTIQSMSSIDRSSMYTAATAIRKDLKKKLIKEHGYFEEESDRARGWLIGAAVGLLILLIVSQPSWGWILGLMWAILNAIFYAFLMRRRSHAGVEAYDHIKGLKLYMNTAEKDRLKMLQSVERPFAEPTKTVHLFEKLLPFAVALGVEKSWSKQFEGLYTQPPSWYSGNFSTFHMATFANTLTTGVSAMNSSFSASTSSSSSGSGGGGFSGGGGGGGGGGGW